MDDGITITLKAPPAGCPAEITLRKPRAGDLRGIKLSELLQLDPAAVYVVVSRCASPIVQPSAFWALGPADLMDVCLAVLGFFEMGGSQSV